MSTTYPRIKFILEAATHISVRTISEDYSCFSLVLARNPRDHRRPLAQAKTPTFNVLECADLDSADLQHVYPAAENSKLEIPTRLAEQGRQTYIQASVAT
ncbi:hypothetical protein PtB15_13B453 [Puccinia triticina]|nr:hypothetical protein PtB15_13B453 [Puccinia triticina]